MVVSKNISAITQAIEELLANDQDFEDTTVCRGEPLNTDPANCPWIGIYRRDLEYEPRTLGLGSGHRGYRGNIVIIAQTSSLASGASCEDELDALVRDIVDAILTDPTIRSSIEALHEVVVTYSYDSVTDDDYEIYHQSAYIQLTVEGKTS